MENGLRSSPLRCKSRLPVSLRDESVRWRRRGATDMRLGQPCDEWRLDSTEARAAFGSRGRCRSTAAALCAVSAARDTACDGHSYDSFRRKIVRELAHVRTGHLPRE